MRRLLLAWALSLLGCREVKDAPSHEAKPRAQPQGSENRTLKVDAALFDSSRLATTTVERRAPSGQLNVPGEVRPSLGAAEVGALVAGRVASIAIVEGARVQRGQVLAWLDAPEVARATADVLRARARSTLAQSKLGRQLELDARQATSKNALDDARAEAAVARTDLLAARTLLQSLGGTEPSNDAEGQQGSLTARVALRAPVAGVVVRRDAVIGAPVTPERTLFWLNGDAPSLIVAHVPEGLSVPAAGERAKIEARTSAAKCEAAVRGEPGVVESATRTVALRLEPDTSCQGLVPGSFVAVSFERPSGAPEGLVVPREAVVDVHGTSVAFVRAGAPGEVAVRAVRVLDQPGPELVVESGLSAGEKVVSRGAILLKGELLRAELSGD